MCVNCGPDEAKAPSAGLNAVVMSEKGEMSDPDRHNQARPDLADSLRQAPDSILLLCGEPI